MIDYAETSQVRSSPAFANRNQGARWFLASCLVGLGLLNGCASTAPSTSGQVRIVSDEPINRPATEQAEAEDALMTDVTPVEALPEGTETVDHRRSLELAIKWARDGVRFYRAGDADKAHKALIDARIAILDADLPEALQELGLGLIGQAIGPEAEGLDLEQLASDLERQLGDTPEPQEQYVEREARRILAKFGAASPSPAYLQAFVDQVQVFIAYYQGRNRAFFERSYGRKHKYWPTIRSVFEAKGIPMEQAYMALVESGFSPRASSHANAIGLWQFIPATGRRYGLRNTTDLRDVERATEAASEYLLDLIGIFGSRSFLLATAAYNSGEGRILRCLRDLEDPFGDRTFWAIQPCLAKETREYVPRIFAAAIIATDPERFGFDLPSEAETAELYDVVTIPQPTSLAKLARDAGVTVAALRAANSDMSSRATSTPVRNFPLYVPKGGGQALIADLSASPLATVDTSEIPLSVQMGAESGTPTTARASRTSTDKPHVNPLPPDGRKIEVRVGAGDTLAEIAQSNGVSIQELKRWNPFLNHRILYRGDRLAVYSDKPVKATRYSVRRGDSLSVIAERHGVKVTDLMRWNNLQSAHRLQIGQNLDIRAAGSSRVTYTVKPGNTLQTIAEVFEVRYRDIMTWNNLRSSRLKVGQKLEIQPPRSFEVKRHKVRRGETVGTIARRYGTTVSSILTANGLTRRATIRSGQQLLIFV